MKKAQKVDNIKNYKKRWEYVFYRRYTDNSIAQLADEMIDYFVSNDDALHYTNFCLDHKIPRTQIYNLAKKYEYFKFALDYCKDIMIQRFIKIGVNAKQSTFAIFILKNIARDEFNDSHEVEINRNGQSTLIKSLIDAHVKNINKNSEIDKKEDGSTP